MALVGLELVRLGIGFYVRVSVSVIASFVAGGARVFVFLSKTS